MTTGQDERVSQSYVVHPAESKIRRDFPDELRSDLDISLAKPETIEMLGLAKQNENRPEYIANLWQAIDVQTESDGIYRKRFIAETFSEESVEIVNNALNNIRAARGRFFHNGIVPDFDHRNVYVAQSFLRICLIPPGPLRNALVRALEAELANPTA